MKKKKFRITKEELQLYSLCVIPVALVFLFSYVPMFGIVLAFKNYRYDKGIWGSDWVGLTNFKIFMQGNEFPRIMRNTICYNLAFIVLGIACAVLVAMLLYNVKSRRAVKTYQTIFIFPNFISMVLVSYMVYALLSPTEGVVNQIIEAFGGEGISWYSNAAYWPVILTICQIWKNVGMKSIYYYAVLVGMDEAMLEAAEIDGANARDKMRYIMLPTLIPTIVILFILDIGGILGGDFGLFYQVPRNVGALYPVTDVLATYNWRVMTQLGNMGLGSAISLFTSVVGMIMVLITNKLSKRVDESLGVF